MRPPALPRPVPYRSSRSRPSFPAPSLCSSCASRSLLPANAGGCSVNERSGMTDDRFVIRFTATERLVHWAFSVLFLVLLATGLALWVPSLAETVGHNETVRAVHIVCGVALSALPLAIALTGDRRS